MGLKIGKTLEAELQIKNLKHKTVAEALNLHPKTFSTYVNDVYFPPLDKLTDICRYLEIDLDHLLQLEKNDNLDLLITGKNEAKVCRMLRNSTKEEAQFIVDLVELAYNNFKNIKK